MHHQCKTRNETNFYPVPPVCGKKGKQSVQYARKVQGGRLNLYFQSTHSHTLTRTHRGK